MMLCEEPLVTACANYESYRMAAPDTVCEGYLLSDDEAPHKGWLDCFESPVELQGSALASGAEGGVFNIEDRPTIVGKVLNDQSDLDALKGTVFRLRIAYSHISNAAPRYEGIGITKDRKRVILMEKIPGGKRLMRGQVDPDFINTKTLTGIKAWYQRMYDTKSFDNDPQFVIEPDGTARPMDFGGLQCVDGFAELSSCPGSIAGDVCRQYFNEWHSARSIATSGSAVKTKEFGKQWYLDLRPGESDAACDFDSEEYEAP